MKFTRVNDKSEFEFDNGVVYKLSGEIKTEIYIRSDTAKRIIALTKGSASNGTKKKFGLVPTTEPTPTPAVTQETTPRPERLRRNKKNKQMPRNRIGRSVNNEHKN